MAQQSEIQHAGLAAGRDQAMANVDLDVDLLRQWLGREHRTQATLEPWPARALASTLDREARLPGAGDQLQPAWHWLYFLEVAPASELGPDGHPKRGGFLPPVPLPRRMWAGGRFWFERPLRIGEAAEKVSTVASVDTKQGRSGPLVFVMVRHEIAGEDGHALTEEHDIVYRDHAPPGPGNAGPPPSLAPAEAGFSREVTPDPVLLFRYSALTFNGHRIHYDRRYCVDVEGYPGLVVHGPLIATLLLDLLVRQFPEASLRYFSYRAMRPLFDTAPFQVCGRRQGGTARLWAQDSQAALAMEGEAELA